MAYGGLASVENNNVSEIPYPETGLTEETRQMYPDNYSDKMNKAFMQVVDEILKPVRPIKLPDHSILIDELELLHEAHITVGGQQNRFNAAVIRSAINVIRAL